MIRTSSSHTAASGPPLCIRAWFGILLYLLNAPTLLAQSSDSSISVLSLAELMSLQVTTASKSPDPLIEAPAVTTVIDRQAILRSGATSLADVLQSAPSLIPYSTYYNIASILSIRGDVSANSNVHVLFLVDGRPFRESLAGTFNRSFLSSFPVSAIERIEIIRGPASVLYGANAYMGVINVVTKMDFPRRIEGSAYAASRSTVGIDLSSKFAAGPLTISPALHAASSDGWPYALTDAAGVSLAPKFPHRELGLFLGADAGPVTLRLFGARHVENLVSLVSPIWLVPPDRTYEERRLLADIGVHQTINESWSFDANVTYNGMRGRHFTSVDSSFDDDFRAKTNDLQFEISSNFSLGSGAKGVVGLLHARQSGDGVYPPYFINTDPSIPYPILPYPVFESKNPRPLEAIAPYNESWDALYIQSSIRVTDELRAVLGGQLHSLTGMPLTTVLRTGLVYVEPSGWGLKVLWGDGFRPGSAIERRTAVPYMLYGNQSIRPERVRSIELQTLITRPKMYGALSYFHSKQTDLITTTRPGERLSNMVNGESTPPGVPFYVNRGTLTLNGVEVEGQGRIGHRLTVRGNALAYDAEYAFQTQEGTDTVASNYFGMPQVVVKLAVDVQLSDWLQGTMTDAWYSRFNTLADAPPVNPELRAFHTIELSLRVHPFASMPGEAWSSLSLQLRARNILNEQIMYPEYSSRSINTVPGSDRRTLSLSVSMDF